MNLRNRTLYNEYYVMGSIKKNSCGHTVVTHSLKANRVLLSVPDVLYTDSIPKCNAQYIPVGQFGYAYGIDTDIRALLNGITTVCPLNDTIKANVTFYYDTINETLLLITLNDVDTDEQLYTYHNIEHLYHSKQVSDASYLEFK
jgi:hypothetical protein